MVYDRLNERLLHFLSNRLGWSDLNSIQKKVIPHILDGNNTLILAPTASGKTEAALIPIFSEILNNHLEPVSVLYISPLKALINDMHNRIESWANHFGLSAMKWHGDVEYTEKKKFSKNPTDFLSITPESLEVILMNRTSGEKERIFNNVKYILIDEIHYFAGSDRGIQLNSLLNRISKYTPNAQTIGLSATVGNPDVIAEWMDLKNPADIVRDTGGRKLQYKVFDVPEDLISSVLEPYKDKKVLIFSNSRKTAELIHYRLEKDLGMKNIFIHHGSINKDTREENEDKFKEVSQGFMVATMTLELGIDIGDIDIVVNLNAPNNVSSFSQRIGRSGRKSKIQRTIILSLGYNLLVSLADLILYHERKVERINISRESIDILFHQLLSSVYEKGKVHFKELYDDLISCYAFSDITFENYKFLLKDMQKRGFIEINSNFLTLGYEFEKEFGAKNYMNFYAVFSPSFEYSIREGGREVGFLDIAYAIDLAAGDEFNLAGKLWVVKSIDHDEYVIYVKKIERTKAKVPQWFSDGAPLSYLVANKIEEITYGHFDDKFLKPFSEGARQSIKVAIRKAEEDGFREGILPIEITTKGFVYIYTFAGDKANKLLAKLFSMYYDISYEFTNAIYTSFMAKDITASDIESLIYSLEDILNQKSTEKMLDMVTSEFKKNKFMQYLPEEVRGKLKMNIIFDKDALLDATLDKSISFIGESSFRKSISKQFFDNKKSPMEESTL